MAGYIPFNLSDVAAAASAETDTRLAGGQQLASAGHVMAQSEQLSQLAAAREQASRNYSFEDEQGRLNRALELGLQNARNARSGGGGGGGGSNSTMEQMFKLALMDKEEENWYKRQQWMLDQEKANAPKEPKRRPNSDYGRDVTQGSKGQGLTEHYDAYKRGEIDTREYVQGGAYGTPINVLRGQGTGRGYMDEVRKITNKGSDPATTEREVYEYFKKLSKKDARINDRNADEWASIALWNLQHIPEQAG